ncbi:division/cell wall cluster transcriptional repressor MraZ [Candidatus Dojkabacteria bacterium]|uniref:Transcriptional regulator MraZ n=1 Tax=Candidatus Dojkabacteria bacterium TaxID=2099670 RepID=A0A955L7A2_9BACT|nr:division/cell wall cluster transcriptional repressor MraZ [Candidatus Dojkabacteria bacterium]
MLIGEYSGKLAEKNRTALPKKLRDELKGTMYMTRGYEQCILVLDEKRWQMLLRTIEIKPFLHQTIRDTKRFLLGGASEIQLDSQGRCMIPAHLQEYGAIEKDLVFVGVGDWIEIWNLDTWNSKIAELSNSAADIAERLGQN